MARTRIKTVCIEPTREMPADVYRDLWRMSYFMELMERVGQNEVIWDAETTSMVDVEAGAETERTAWLKGWIGQPVFEISEAMAAELGVGVEGVR